MKLDFINNPQQQFRELDQAARQFGRSLSDAFAGGIAQGKSFGKVLDDVRQKFIETSLKAALKPFELLLSSSVNSLLQGSVGKAAPFTLGNLGTLFGGAAGGQSSGFLPAQIAANLTVPNAQGGIVSGPTFFPLGRGLGLMGEAGPEAIMPLARGPDGRLGVATAGGGGAVTITVNIATPDADSFARSEAQVSAALARAVARGRRGL